MQRLQQSENTTASPRYDSDAVRQILARATELEQQESDQLSAEQVEALGRELGINPQAVRRAIGEREGVLVETQTRHTTTARLPLTIRNLWKAFVPVLYFVVATCCFTGWVASVYPRQLPVAFEILLSILFFILPVVGAFWNGRRLRDQRLALMSGGIGAVLLYTAGYITICAATNNWDALPLLFVMIIIGLTMLTSAAGALGVATSEERLRKPIPLSARDTDR